MAFYDVAASGRAACRAYLVTADQFADVVAQEMRRPPGGEFARNLAGAARPRSVRSTPWVRAATRRSLRLGEHDGVPMFTVTHDDVAGLELAAPTAPYLRWIAAGLHDAHGWDSARIGGYLAAAPGARGVWTEDEIAALAAPPERDSGAT